MSKAYWQLKSVQIIVTIGSEIRDHKQAGWLAFDIATLFHFLFWREQPKCSKNTCNFR